MRGCVRRRDGPEQAPAARGPDTSWRVQQRARGAPRRAPRGDAGSTAAR